MDSFDGMLHKLVGHFPAAQVEASVISGHAAASVLFAKELAQAVPFLRKERSTPFSWALATMPSSSSRDSGW